MFANNFISAIFESFFILFVFFVGLGTSANFNIISEIQTKTSFVHFSKIRQKQANASRPIFREHPNLNWHSFFCQLQINGNKKEFPLT